MSNRDADGARDDSGTPREERVRQSPWAREGGENVECVDCPLLYDKTHPNLPLKTEVTGQCPHCALRGGSDE